MVIPIHSAELASMTSPLFIPEIVTAIYIALIEDEADEHQTATIKAFGRMRQVCRLWNFTVVEQPSLLLKFYEAARDSTWARQHDVFKEHADSMERHTWLGDGIIFSTETWAMITPFVDMCARKFSTPRVPDELMLYMHKHDLYVDTGLANDSYHSYQDRAIVCAPNGYGRTFALHLMAVLALRIYPNIRIIFMTREANLESEYTFINKKYPLWLRNKFSGVLRIELDEASSHICVGRSTCSRAIILIDDVRSVQYSSYERTIRALIRTDPPYITYASDFMMEGGGQQAPGYHLLKHLQGCSNTTTVGRFNGGLPGRLWNGPPRRAMYRQIDADD